MCNLRLVDVDGLELVKPGLCSTQSQRCRLGHQAQFGIQVRLLFVVAERMPAITMSGQRLILKMQDQIATYHAFRNRALLHVLSARASGAASAALPRRRAART